jgi:hypothetical protein
MSAFEVRLGHPSSSLLVERFERQNQSPRAQNRRLGHSAEAQRLQKPESGVKMPAFEGKGWGNWRREVQEPAPCILTPG